MQKSTFKISKMDCPSEERMIRMKLADFSAIQGLDFDIPNRRLIVHHTGEADLIFQELEELKFDTSLLETVEATHFQKEHEDTAQERKLLWTVLIINVSFFLIEIFAGWIADSMGLVADSLDMLADGMVYGMALLAVGGSISRKKNIAKLAGYFQIILATLGFVEVIRRTVGFEKMPDFLWMMTVSFFALIANAICLYLLQKGKSKEAHMQASMIFTSNDIIINLGVILAGGLVYATASKLPDLVIGIIVFVIVGRGALKILKLSK
jgi:Co/Zn/Cd efflux system component